MPPEDDKLEEIRSGVGELLQWKAALDVRCETHREKTDSLHSTVFGNPDSADNPGLKTNVQGLMDFKNSRKRSREWLMDVVKVVAAALLIAVILWIMKQI